MKEDKKNIDLLFEEKLKPFREAPPAHSWDRLEKDLNRAAYGKRLFYFRLAAASVLVLIAFGAGYFYATYQSSPSQQISQELITPVSEPESNQTGVLVENEFKNEPAEQKDEVTFSSQSAEPILATSAQTDQTTIINQPVVLDNENKTLDVLIAELAVKDNITTEQNDKLPEMIDEEITQKQIIPAEDAIATNQDKLSKENEIADYKPLVLDNNAKVYGMESTQKKQASWSVGAQFAPVWSYRDISINYANQSGNNVQDVESQLNNAEDALLAYAGGIDVSYFLSDRWSIQSGMYYSKIGQVNNDALSFRQENQQFLLYSIRTSTGTINIALERIPDDIRKINPPKDTLTGINIDNVKIIQNFDLFEVPVMIKYKILDKKMGINISGGLSPAYLLSNNTVLQVEGDKYDIGNSANLNNMIFNSSISLGLNYSLSKKLSLNLEPNFKYSLSPINKDSQFDYHPYYFSFFTGMSYKF
jgi:hypothetical protein